MALHARTHQPPPGAAQRRGQAMPPRRTLTRTRTRTRTLTLTLTVTLTLTLTLTLTPTPPSNPGQVCALTWYVLSYVPGGAPALKLVAKVASRGVRSCCGGEGKQLLPL